LSDGNRDQRRPHAAERFCELFFWGTGKERIWEREQFGGFVAIRYHRHNREAMSVWSSHLIAAAGPGILQRSVKRGPEL
jgi:hypothetical protein